MGKQMKKVILILLGIITASMLFMGCKDNNSPANSENSNSDFSIQRDSPITSEEEGDDSSMENEEDSTRDSIDLTFPEIDF